MFSLPEHSIAFEGLKEQLYKFDYELGSDFFELVPIEELSGGALKADVGLSKRGSMLDVNVSMSGNIITFCDRCSQELSLAVEGQIRQVFKTAGREESDHEEVIIIPSNEHEINLTSTFYECLMLAVPQRKVHDEKDCDPQVLQALTRNDDQEQGVDPRWEALKGLTG